jgi:hypothetical protein
VLLAAVVAAMASPASVLAVGDPPRPSQAPPLTPFSPPQPRGVAPPLGPLPTTTSAPGSQPLSSYPLPRHGLLRGISDGHTFILDNIPALSSAAMGVAAADGVRSVRIPVVWRSIEHSGPPADRTDPADPAYDFRFLDVAVRAARRAGLDPLLVPINAPDRGEAPGRWRYAPPGTWAPIPQALGAFATALARRYSGTFADPLLPGEVLPAVHRWQAWNEPNLPVFLQPQWVVAHGRWVAYAPLRYRAMLNAFTAGIRVAQPAAVVASAGTAPLGEQRDGEGRMAPVRFWRSLLCLPSKPGAGAPSCPDPAHFDAFAVHPISIRDPGRPARQRLDVAISDLGKVLTLLHEAQRARRVVPSRGQSLWITELNWDSKPPNPNGGDARQVAHWVSEGLYRLWRMGATLVDWQFLRDPLPGVAHPAGLYRISARLPRRIELDRPKPALRSYRLPFVAERVSARRVRVWALLAPAVTSAVVERRGATGWAPITTLRSRTGGFVLDTIALRRAGRLRVRIPNGWASAAWHVGSRGGPLR